MPTRIDNRYLLSFIPPVPEGYWGSVTFNYKDGQIITIDVQEKVKP